MHGNYSWKYAQWQWRIHIDNFQDQYYLAKCERKQWRIQHFPKVGAPTLHGAPRHGVAKFSRKLLEIERIWMPGRRMGWGRETHPHLDPPMEDSQVPRPTYYLAKFGRKPHGNARNCTEGAYLAPSLRSANEFCSEDRSAVVSLVIN